MNQYSLTDLINKKRRARYAIAEHMVHHPKATLQVDRETGLCICRVCMILHEHLLTVGGLIQDAELDRTRAKELRELVSRITPENRHGENE